MEKVSERLLDFAEARSQLFRKDGYCYLTVEEAKYLLSLIEKDQKHCVMRDIYLACNGVEIPELKKLENLKNPE